MKKDQVYTFPISRELTPEGRTAVARELDEQAKTLEEPLVYAWDEEDDGQLHIDIGPAKLDVVFYKTIVELYVEAPLWARVLITKEKEAAIVSTVQAILQRAHLAEQPGGETSAASA